jgi:RNA polymerase sigma factor (sigma-70 family)
MTVVLMDIDVTKRKNNDFYGANEDKMFTLAEYLEIAEKCIAKFASPSIVSSMLNNEDAISFVAEHLMDGTIRWKESGGRTLKSYLNQCSIWAITRWIGKQTSALAKAPMSINQQKDEEENQFYSMIADRDISDSSESYWSDISDQVTEIITNPVLTETQSECMRLRYQQGYTNAEIGEQMGFSKQGANNHLQNAMRKLQDVYSQ